MNTEIDFSMLAPSDLWFKASHWEAAAAVAVFLLLFSLHPHLHVSPSSWKSALLNIRYQSDSQQKKKDLISYNMVYPE